MSASFSLRCAVAILGWVAGFMPAAFAAQVTFQVNLSAQTALGRFDPATDAVSVAGDPINGWSTAESPLVPSDTTPGLWTGTFDVSGNPGATGQYKFVMTTATGTTWEGNVGTGGGTGNRTFRLADTDQTLPVVFFNNVTATSSVTSAVTFRVDMAVQISQGAFDPDGGTVTLAGEFNAWNTAAFELTRSGPQSTVWSGTLTLTGARDGALAYKFVMNGGTWEGNVGANGAQNRSFTLTAGDQTLPLVFFNNTASIPTAIPLTFRLNLASRIALGTFDPDADTVSVAGDLLNNWITSSSVLERESADSTVWKGTFEVTSAAGATVLFKFVVNGGTWESIENRSYTLTGTEPQTLPLLAFDNLETLAPLNLGPLVGGRVTLSWTAGPRVRLQTASDFAPAAWQDVPATEGQDSATVTIGPGRAFFRLTGP